MKLQIFRTYRFSTECILFILFFPATFSGEILFRVDCDMACHKKCEKLTGNLCGLNQKLVAEALQALKRGKTMTTNNFQGLLIELLYFDFKTTIYVIK